eukprot:4720326-Pleurochrysis_carterae.AAC.8
MSAHARVMATISALRSTVQRKSSMINETKYLRVAVQENLDPAARRRRARGENKVRGRDSPAATA